MSSNRTATAAILNSILISFLELLSQENQFTHHLTQLSSWIRAEHYYDTVIFMRHGANEQQYNEDSYNTDQVIKHLMQDYTIPIINMRDNTSYILWHRFNRRYLAIAELNGNMAQDKQLLQTLWTSLKRNIQTKLIILLREDNNIKSNAENLLKFCHANQVLNVIAIPITKQQSNNYYGMQVYPEFRMQLKTLGLKHETILYPDHIDNMHGHPIRLFVGENNLRCYILEKRNNTIVLGGYVGHYFMEFTRKHNATVIMPSPNTTKGELFITDVEALLGNGTFDVSAGLTLDLFSVNNAYTRAYDYTDWCIMVPVEKDVPAFMFYVMVFDGFSLLLIFVTFIVISLVLLLTYVVKGEHYVLMELILNIYVLNGLLGQSFKFEHYFAGVRSFLFMLVCMGGLVFNTTYSTYLQTFNAKPPKIHFIENLDDLKRSGLPVAFHVDEYKLLQSFETSTDLLSLATVIPSNTEFLALRDSFDSRYAYPITSSQWETYEQQQKRFAKPRFRFSNICVMKMMAMQIPLSPNSPYVEHMNDLIGQVTQAGLVSYWKSLAFSESVQMKAIKLDDGSMTSTFEPMKLGDMKLLMFLFAEIVVLLCICFIIEIYWPHRGKFTKKLTRCIRKVWCRRSSKRNIL